MNYFYGTGFHAANFYGSNYYGPAVTAVPSYTFFKPIFSNVLMNINDEVWPDDQCC